MRAVTHSDDPGAAAAYWSAQMERSPLPRHAISERQQEIDATIHIIYAALQDLDDYLNATRPSELMPDRAFHSAKELQDAILLAITITGKYGLLSAGARSALRDPAK